MNLKPYIYGFCGLITFLILPVPKEWDAIVDSSGGLLSDYVWFIGIYAVLGLAFHLLAKLTNLLFFKVMTILSIGKLIDQFFNPYGYHVAELVWDLMIIIWLYYQWKEKCKKTIQS